MKTHTWTPPDNQSMASLHICCDDEEVMHYIFDLVMKINAGIDSYDEDGDEVVVEYESVKEATEVFDCLREQLYELHPTLIEHPEGVFMDDEDNVLHFKNCEIWVWER